MAKIKNVEYNNNYIELEVKNKYIYKIPINEYSKNLFNKAINQNKFLYKDIKYYEKCADISLFPIWLATPILIYGIITNFILLDLIFIATVGMVGISLLSTSIFKIASKKLKNQANNNEYFTKLYEYALTGKKDKKYEKQKIVKNIQSSRYSKKGSQIIQDEPLRATKNQYHLSSNEIIQDEIVASRKSR